MEHERHLEGLQRQYKLPRKCCLLIFNVGLDLKKALKWRRVAFFNTKVHMHVKCIWVNISNLARTM